MEPDPPGDDSDVVKQKSNWELHRRYALAKKDGWTPTKLEAISRKVDLPFTRHRKTYKLHRLPAEIRNRIYEFALASDAPVDATQHPRDAIPPLLQVCRQVRLEALPFFYAHNTSKHIFRNASTAHVCPVRISTNTTNAQSSEETQRAKATQAATKFVPSIAPSSSLFAFPPTRSGTKRKRDGEEEDVSDTSARVTTRGVKRLKVEGAMSCRVNSKNSMLSAEGTRQKAYTRTKRSRVFRTMYSLVRIW